QEDGAFLSLGRDAQLQFDLELLVFHAAGLKIDAEIDLGATLDVARSTGIFEGKVPDILGDDLHTGAGSLAVRRAVAVRAVALFALPVPVLLWVRAAILDCADITSQGQAAAAFHLIFA